LFRGAIQHFTPLSLAKEAGCQWENMLLRPMLLVVYSMLVAVTWASPGLVIIEYQERKELLARYFTVKKVKQFVILSILYTV
jgi:hypothetical protein